MIDAWIARKISSGSTYPLSRSELEDYQLSALKRVIEDAKRDSPFYRDHLSGISPDDIKDLSCITSLPLMDENDIAQSGTSMLTISATEISRIVTMPTSGSSGEAKRLYFSAGDIELMADYVHNGLSLMSSPGETFMLLMPCEKPGSIGDVVAEGLRRIGARVVPYGILPEDGSRDQDAIETMRTRDVRSLLSTAKAALRLSKRTQGLLKLRSVLLSADYVAAESVSYIQSAWDCLVYEHYGMTEMGLGGAMMCEAREGYHPREADLLIEIVDPFSGEALEDGEWGEIVFTTLTREAMPLIRYRTGDISRFMIKPCPCGSVLKRLDRVRDRGLSKNY